MLWNLTFCALIIVSLKMQQPEAKLSLKVSFDSSRATGIVLFNNKKYKILEIEKRNNGKEDIRKPTNFHQRLWIFSNDDDQYDLQTQSKAINTKALKMVEKNDAKRDILKQLKNNMKINEDKKWNIKTKKTTTTATTTTKATTKTPNRVLTITKQWPPLATVSTPAASELKSDFPTSFINPFGQLSSFLSSDHLQFLQDYRFLFHAERDTIFQLHSPTMTTIGGSESDDGDFAGNNEERVFNKFFGATSGVNSVSTSDCPSSVKVEEVRLYDAASLRKSRFNPFNPTRILIHGWFGGSNAGVYKTLVPEYLKLENGIYNLFTVDWGRGAIADYITASYRVKPVGKVLAKFIDFLHRESGMLFEDLHIIGFSMGAHVAGIAGKFVQTGRLPIIYALDPALPLFRYENINERIALTDADYVEVIHTSVGSYGYDRPLGHVDFYINYGSSQPGCFFNECNHIRAFQVFAESLHNPNAFRGEGCDVSLWSDLIKNHRCLMETGRNLTMGGNPTDLISLRKRGGGVYNLFTNSSPPYGRS